MSFDPKNELVRSKSLRVQELALNFVIESNATPASVTITKDDPSILFLNTEGVNQITAALAEDDTAPTFVSPDDSDGKFSILVNIGEPVAKMVCAYLVNRTTTEVVACKLTSAPSDSIVAGGLRDKIVLDADSGVDLSAADGDYCLVLKYMASPR